ncbi:hypothetical protein BC940DRAFT_294372 [Gongronella butleri]|nr:hypothetical protein BC940DRAFT_294372 [Gongronella butleri]
MPLDASYFEKRSTDIPSRSPDVFRYKAKLLDILHLYVTYKDPKLLEQLAALKHDVTLKLNAERKYCLDTWDYLICFLIVCTSLHGIYCKNEDGTIFLAIMTVMSWFFKRFVYFICFDPPNTVDIHLQAVCDACDALSYAIEHDQSDKDHHTV